MCNYNAAMMLVITFQYWDFNSWHTDQKLHARDPLFLAKKKNPVCIQVDDEGDKWQGPGFMLQVLWDI